MSVFRVGQKVVLVDDSTHSSPSSLARIEGEKRGVKYPIKGKVYTVRKTVVISNTEELAILLVEIDNGEASVRFGFKNEAAFLASRFRPVVERKTDISIFKALLNTTPEKVTA
ncbi:hypothetical protein [Allorhizobium ampelinum]|uniref:hypothetical protein n=1 Tax=Allorhizobium ampelinum TaxID=3025782 RepID=UPI000B3FA2CD|nr:hypothetical protein [Allorhizobium ampelinum]NTA27435.1 hypothetical protein [Allorhizobium ampelinum]OVE94492.1 hypothetical protein B7W85_13145 [Allorhizobium ampelinum]